eukprot:5592690-Ditylum_brightwellii.AAC.1
MKMTMATYVYEMCENIISKLLYAGTYRDDGLAIFKGQRTVTQIICWLRDFQLQVDEVADGNFFQFTAGVWTPQAANNLPTIEEGEEDLGGMLPEEWEKWKERVMVMEEEEFPTLI